ARVLLMDAAEGFHQRGVAGGVLAAQRHDLAGARFARFVVDRDHRPESFADAAHFKQGCGRATHNVACSYFASARSFLSLTMKSSTPSFLIASVGTISCLPGGMPDLSPSIAFASLIID